MDFCFYFSIRCALFICSCPLSLLLARSVGCLDFFHLYVYACSFVWVNWMCTSFNSMRPILCISNEFCDMTKRCLNAKYTRTLLHIRSCYSCPFALCRHFDLCAVSKEKNAMHKSEIYERTLSKFIPSRECPELCDNYVQVESNVI